MYTGIITDIGRVRKIVPGGVTRFEVETAYDTARIALGASIALSGPCFTVVDKGTGWFAVEASRETLDLTTAAAWAVGTRLNLERSLTVGAEMGGHYVTGHVDGTAVVVGREADGDSQRFRFRVAPALGRFIAAKGSVALDGVSLTVNEVEDRRDGTTVFGVNIIPHTLAHTTFADRAEGDRVNVEVDMLARYAARLGTADRALLPPIATGGSAD
ncbi:MAG: riboflavin synthase [Alphaproteobacteria bacterium]